MQALPRLFVFGLELSRNMDTAQARKIPKRMPGKVNIYT